MFYHAKNSTVAVKGVPMDYVVFGKGQTPLVILPGLADGLKTVRGMAVPLAILYRQFAQQFTVYMFSRKTVLEKGYSTKEMARDQKIALESLGISSCNLLGVSQGGMIAQHLAIDFPEMVESLIVAVSSSRPSEAFCDVVSNWIRFAENSDYKSLMIDTAEHAYTPQKLKSYRFPYPIVSRVGKPKDFSRFLIQANACLTHNTYSELGKIHCPTLVIGGGQDRVVGKEAAKEMAGKIDKSSLLIYEELGHAAYEESKDFNQQVIDFCLKP